MQLSQISFRSTLLTPMPPVSHTARWTARSPTKLSRRLLIVDDYRDGAESISMLLTLAGYDVRFVLRGGEALDTAKNHAPSVALVDINMPVMDGFSVARQLRQDCQTEGILLIAYTALDESAVRGHGIAAGFDGYCQKVGPDLLLRLLHRIVR